MKRILAVLFLCSSVALAADMSAPTKLMGYISESKCGAAHNASAQDPACVKKCIASGAKPVFVDDAKKQVWAIDNPDAVKEAIGKPVTVIARADSGSMTVHIDKVTKVGPVKTTGDTMKMD